MPEPTDYDRMMWEALNEDIAHPLTAEVPVVPAGVVLQPLTPNEPVKPQVPEYAPPTAAAPVIAPVPVVEPVPVVAPEPVLATAPQLEPIQIEDEPVVQSPSIDFNKILREPQTSSIVIDREQFPTGAIDLPPIEDVLRANTGATKLPWVKAGMPATGVDSREADGTGPIDIVKPVSAAVAGAKIKTGIRKRSKRQTTLAFVTAGLMMLVGGLFLAAYFLGYLR